MHHSAARTIGPPPLTEGSIVRALVRLSIPVVLTNVLQSAYQITDTFWVGRLSQEAIAAVSLAFPFSFLMIAVGSGLPIAGAVLIGQYKGRGDDQAMNHVAAQTLLMVLAVSILTSGVGFALSGPLMRLMGAEPSVLPDAVTFLEYTFLGFVFVFGFYVYQSLMRGLGVVKIPMYIVLLTVLLNLVLDPLFIFGWGPIPALGVAGAALATLFTQALATIIGFTHMYTSSEGFRLQLRDFRPDWRLIWKCFRLGAPASAEQAARAMSFTLMMMLVAQFGTTATAAFGSAMRVIQTVMIPALGFSLATSTVVSQNIGAGKIDRAERTSWVGVAMSFVVLASIGIPICIWCRPLITFFVPEGGESIEVAVYFTRMFALTLGFAGIQQVITGTLRGAGNTTAALMQAIVTQWMMRFPLAYVLAYHTSLGVNGIWWAMSVSNPLGALLTVTWFLSSDWKQTKLLDDARLEEQISEAARMEENIAS
jgi:putative MATE family efflux protein